MEVRVSENEGSHTTNLQPSTQSEAVRHFISRKPDFLIAHSTVLFLLLIISITVGCWFIQYPDIVSVPAKLISNNVTKPTICNTTGKNSEFYLEAYISKENFAKVKQGQVVFVRFQAFPYGKFGSVRGTIGCISSISTDSGYLAKVDLTAGLKTDDNKQIPFKDGLQAIAQIRTGNIRLVKRIFSGIFQQFKN